MPDKCIIAIDQGTTSTRAIIFNHAGAIVSTGQKEHEQIFPRAGWVEHNPMEIWTNVREVIGIALAKADLTRHDIAAQQALVVAAPGMQHRREIAPRRQHQLHVHAALGGVAQIGRAHV